MKFSEHPIISDLRNRQFVLGRTGKAVSTAALSSRNNLAVLANLLKSRPNERTLEIGLALGASACTIAEFHRARGALPAGQHVAIDPFQDSVWDDSGILTLEQSGLARYCTIIKDFSSVALPKLLGNGTRFDLVYIDGSHLFEDVFVDVYFSARLIRLGGFLLLDDSSDPHVHRVLRFMRTNMDGLREVDLTPYRASSTRREKIGLIVAKAMGRIQLTGFECVGEVTRAWNAPFREF